MVVAAQGPTNKVEDGGGNELPWKVSATLSKYKTLALQGDQLGAL